MAGADLLGDRPHQAGACRVDPGRQVLAVQAETGLEAQTVAGGKADPLHALVLEQRGDEIARVGFR